MAIEPSPSPFRFAPLSCGLAAPCEIFEANTASLIPTRVKGKTGSLSGITHRPTIPPLGDPSEQSRVGSSPSVRTKHLGDTGRELPAQET